MFNRKPKKEEQKEIVKLMVCRLSGHKIVSHWHWKFNKRKTKRKRIRSYICIPCIADGLRAGSQVEDLMKTIKEAGGI